MTVLNDEGGAIGGGWSGPVGDDLAGGGTVKLKYRSICLLAGICGAICDR
jgi:hypothetical protein